MAQKPDEGAAGPSRVCATTGDEVEISSVCEAKRSATVHGVVLQLSPVKDNKLKSRKWFDGQICDGKSALRMVSYDAKLWGAMDKSREEQRPIALRNCSIQRSKRTLDLEVIANDNTEVTASPKKYKIDKSVLGSKPSVKLYSISEACKLAPGAIISVMAKVTVVKPPEKLLKKDRKTHVTKQDCLISDSSGTCRIVLWADRVGALKDHESYHLQNVVLRQYNNKKYISVLEHDSELVPIPDIGKVDETHVEEEKVIEGEIQSVLGLEQYPSCKECHSKVVQIDGVCGQCSRCDTVVKLSKCPSGMVAKVKVEDDNGHSHHATMFNKIILAIVGDGPHGNTTAIATQLLQSEKMTFKINNKDVITEINRCQMSKKLDETDLATAVDSKGANTWREDPAEVD